MIVLYLILVMLESLMTSNNKIKVNGFGDDVSMLLLGKQHSHILEGLHKQF